MHYIFGAWLITAAQTTTTILAKMLFLQGAFAISYLLLGAVYGVENCSTLNVERNEASNVPGSQSYVAS